ncbi:sphere organelles protein-related protein [Artemisia annua]|uniref:Sphere organelles protein-related protein n=1 Tax=Artemisia annua TaxID=35608 RepID=A0A2U1Q698_ARTAN|nr:sphere organelles protein-related protein [Artemisia annua]
MGELAGARPPPTNQNISRKMEEYVLPPSETHILKDNDIICVKRKVIAIEQQVSRREAVDNGMLPLANGEFDKENGVEQASTTPDEAKKK